MLTNSMIRSTADARLALLRAGIRENLARGTMARVRDAADVLAREAAHPMTLVLVKGRKVLASIPVETINDASALWGIYRDARPMASPSSLAQAEVFVDGAPRGYVAWNGKVYAGSRRGWKSGDAPIYDPSVAAEA